MAFGDSTRSRLLLFGGLYFAQGVPWGFVTVAIVLRLAGLGVGPAAIGGILVYARIAWITKPLIGLFVDRAGGRLISRRSLLLGAEAAMAVTLLALAFVDPRAQMGLFLGLVLVNNLCVATQDVLTDSVALAVLPPDERGRAGGVMSASKYAGVLVGGSGLAWVGEHIGWGTASSAAVVLLLIPATLVGLAREPPVTAEAPNVLAEALRSIVTRAAALGALFAVIVSASDHFLAPLASPLLRQRLGLSADRVNLLLFLAITAAIAGSLVGGALSDRLGSRRAIVVGVLGVAVAHSGFALVEPLWRDFGLLATYQIAGGIAGGIRYAAIVTLFMHLTNPRVAATHFQLYMALLNVPGAWAPIAGGHLAERAPAPLVFGVGALLELLPLALLPFLARRRPVT